MIVDVDQLEVIHAPERLRFEAEIQDEKAIVAYRVKGRKMLIVSTRVPPQAEGQGVAAKLTRKALSYARDQGYGVVPLCSYTQAYLRRHRDNYSDLTM